MKKKHFPDICTMCSGLTKVSLLHNKPGIAETWGNRQIYHKEMEACLPVRMTNTQNTLKQGAFDF